MDKLIFKDEANTKKGLPGQDDKVWKVLVVDDEEDVHAVTRFALENYAYKGKTIEFFNAYTEEEAKKIVTEHSDIAVVLLDVVMDDDDSGLRVVEYIRNELKNKFVRIVLRTGHLGQAPEDEVMFSYDINDYKDRTELTNKKFVTTITAALSNYLDIMTIESFRKTLYMSESKYRMLLENLPQRIFYKNNDLIYVSCNENYANDLKIKPEDIEGKTDYDLYPRELAEKYRADDKRIMESGCTEDIEEKYVTNGQELLVHTVKTSIKGEHNSVIGILGIFWDITEKRVLEMEAIRNRQMVSLGEMAAGVAHEVNNPINGIINWAQLLFNKSSKGSNEKEIADWIMKEGGRISKIVSSLLSFARHSTMKEEKSKVYVHEILSETLILIEAQLLKDGITITKSIPSELPGIIANFHEIQQVFLNLLINARYALNQKYPESHDNKVLEIMGEKTTINDRLYIKIVFYDRGIGIPANIKDKIQEPFFTIKPEGDGTGLGLSISNNIIKGHSGKLVIDSVEGEFTKVVLNLQVAVHLD